MVNYANQINESGTDQIINNSRVRAGTPGTNAQGVLWMQGTGVVTSLGTGAQTLTAAQLGGGIIVHNPSGGSISDTLDTAANIVAYMNANSAGVSVGDIMQCILINGSTSNTITIAAGSGGSLDTNQPTPTLPSNVSKTINIRITNVTTPAYVVYV